MDAAHAADEFVAGAEIEVVGVGEDELRAGAGGAEVFEDALLDGFDRSGSAYGHEDRRFDDAVRKLELSAATAFQCGALDMEAEVHALYAIRAQRRQAS